MALKVTPKSETSPKPADPTMKKLLEANTSYGMRRISEVFRDFCELSALAIRNSVDLHGRDEREQRYLRIISGYTSEEADRFAELLAKLVVELDGELSDVLGQLYMSLDLGSDEMGQFFTPYQVSQLMAGMNAPDFAAHLAEREFITVSEPTCGSGGMIVALAGTMRDAGFNYQRQLHVTAQDIESTAVHMTYIALSLLHIPAVVLHGNTLTQEVTDRWFTPAHILDGWAAKLLNRTGESVQDAGKPAPGGSLEELNEWFLEEVQEPVPYVSDEPAERASKGSGDGRKHAFVQ